VNIAVGAAIGIVFTPVNRDPYTVWTYGGIAVASFLAGCVFRLCFRDSERPSSVIDVVDLTTQVSNESTKGNNGVSIKTRKL
jgi:POT family proton-dependent oligopeptide transporter